MNIGRLMKRAEDDAKAYLAIKGVCKCSGVPFMRSTDIFNNSRAKGYREFMAAVDRLTVNKIVDWRTIGDAGRIIWLRENIKNG